MSKSLQDQSVVVIGAGSGIGAAVAALARAEGARVFGISRSGLTPSGVLPVAADVSDTSAIHNAFDEIGIGIGIVQHLVYTAGAHTASVPLAQLAEGALESAFEVKLFRAVQTIRLILPRLSPDASITLTSGQVSRKFGTGTVVKGTLNAAVDAAGRHLAKELAPRRVNVVSPGVTDTALWGEEGSERRKAFLSRVSKTLPVARVGAPTEIAQAYLFAMTNCFVTGAIIDVDGGGLL